MDRHAFVDVDGLSIAYVRAGEGPPVVLLHGYVGDGSATWRPQLEGLSDEFDLVAWDAPGAGRSADPPDTFGIAGYADCLASFIEELALEQPHLVGLSFGGAVAIEFSRRHPTKAATLTLASAYAGWAGSLSAEVAEQRLHQALELAALPVDQFAEALLPTMFSAGPSQEHMDEFGASVRRFHPAGFRAMARAAFEDVSAALPEIEVPTLLVYGDTDVRAPLDVASALHATIASSTLVVLPQVGHLCNLEAPEAFNESLRAFIRRSCHEPV